MDFNFFIASRRVHYYLSAAAAGNKRSAGLKTTKYNSIVCSLEARLQSNPKGREKEEGSIH